jgi:hypothetical protein
LIATKGYTDAELPTQQTINKKLNLLGYSLSGLPHDWRARD